jgi:hypothetical protein
MEWPIWTALGVSAIVVLVVFFVMKRRNPSQESSGYSEFQLLLLIDDAEDNGIPGEATILNTEHLDYDENDTGRSFFKLVLDVTSSKGGPSYKVDADSFIKCPGAMKWSIPTPYANHLTSVGERIPVLIHPTEPGVVVVDEKKVMELAKHNGMANSK